MSTITTINASDLITNSRAVINTNFSNLNTDKIETSYLDTDTTLAANSDTKIATQKAVKAYVDTGGNVNASETTRGIVEEATDAEVTAGTATGATGAKLFITPAKLATYKATFTYLNSVSTGIASRDISTASGDQSIAHGLGVVPKLIKLTVLCSTNSHINHAFASYTASSSVYSSLYFPLGAASVTSTTAYIICNDDGGDQRGTFGTQTSTNIVISWTKNSSPSGGSMTILWEAFA